MTDLLEPGPARVMNDEEQLLADQVYEAIQDASNQSERSQQSADFRLGISDLGFCSEKVRRMVAGIPEPVTDKLAAFIGTALGDHVERAILHRYPNAIRQAEVSVRLVGDGGTYTVSGHPDVVFPHGLLVDVKTTRGLNVVRRTGPTQQQQFQRHLYALGAYEKNLFSPDVSLENVKVANVWLDRAGEERGVYVHMEPYSQAVVEQASFWIDDLVYAYLHHEAARKEPPREVCAKTCGHFADCRALDTDTEGLLTDDDVLVSVDLYLEAAALAKQAERMKAEAKDHLVGVAGSTGKHTVRWVHISGAHVEYDRGPSDRLDIRAIT